MHSSLLPFLNTGQDRSRSPGIVDDEVEKISA